MAGGLEQVAEGKYRVTGDMLFANAANLLAQGDQMFQRFGEVELDLSAVSRADSAGLAVILEWFRQATSAGVRISLKAVPERLVALARISEVHSMLGLPGAPRVDVGSGG